MNCEDTQALLDGYADGELDLVNHLQIEQHLAECADCALKYKNIMDLRSALSDETLYYRAPATLRNKIRAAVRESKPDTTKAKWWNWRWMPTLAAAAIMVAVLVATFAVFRPTRSNEDLVASEVVSSHVRSMMIDGHLMDVPSSDQHTVKPWFDGKLDFAPPVVDLAPQGFALIGGRLDYVEGRPVAALVYQRRQHKINLFIYPMQNGADNGTRSVVKQGYNLVHWNRSGMTFWAVSDINLNELQEFAQDLQN